MEKLSAQDQGFLKMDTPRCPFHVAGLMILKIPENAPRNYIRGLVTKCGRLNELWPAFNRKLRDPDDLSGAVWIEADDYVPERHVYHYALPAPGRMQDLVALATRAHERPMDRSRPLWEVHVVEGLGANRFAIYCKVHHAVVDGVGAMQMLQGLFSTSPRAHLEFSPNEQQVTTARNSSLLKQLGTMRRGLLRQYRAIPELSRLLAHMGADAIGGRTDAMRLPFTAPRTRFNREIDSRRAIVLCELPLGPVKAMARKAGGSVNDVLLAVCGGALRAYLLAQNELYRSSLVAGMPVSLKSHADDAGNKLSYIIAPFFTNEPDALKRLQRVVKVTAKAKAELSQMSTAAAEDYYALIMAPTILLTLTGNATRVRPVINAIFSNVPGSREKLYLEGAELESIYPLSIVTDAMGLNITVLSHVNKLCIAVASCPRDQPDIESLGPLLKQSYRDLRAAL
ncbi:wax ester/triacylglycerol synthase family O-acyltransferase [Seongchinamella unica]|uniref:diacylglycerol O-acyltransferase n=1 Tax=Seongchinamella unica TaxID=2547392 RepID=A0A4V2ZX61_9GAMM|nr:wax ester/triacylglycerol synthase family O-acyltransferase [Seongchinamella unica]TDG13394.1 wax ester/triacylglycerol synthase family O-acyltransferase [Seongchinamella unica]